MDWKEAIRSAKQEISTADYMSSITTSIIRDKEVLLSMLSHADNAIGSAVDSMLFFEKEKKRLKMIPASEELRRQIFFEHFLEKIGASRDEKKTIDELNAIISAHKRQRIEIPRGDKVVIVYNGYKTATLDAGNITKYLRVAKAFVAKVEGILIETK